MNRLRAWLLLWFQVSRNSIFTFGLIESFVSSRRTNCLIENVQSLGTENGKLRGRWGRLSCLELVLSQMMVYGLHLRKIPHILCLQSYGEWPQTLWILTSPRVSINVRNMVASKDDTRTYTTILSEDCRICMHTPDSMGVRTLALSIFYGSQCNP